MTAWNECADWPGDLSVAENESGHAIRKTKEKGIENTDGPDMPRPIGQHGPQHGLLAGGIRGALFCLQRRWCGSDIGLAERRTAADRPQERSAGKSNPCDGTVQEGPGGAERACPHPKAGGYEVGRFRHHILCGRSRSD